VPALPGPHLLHFLGWIILNRLFRWWHSTFQKLTFDLVLSPGINCLDADVVIVHALFHRLVQVSREQPGVGARAQPSAHRALHRRLYYALLSRLESRIYSDPKVALATVSRRMAVLLSDYFGRRDVAIIPNGVDTSFFSASARLAARDAARKLRGYRNEDFVLLMIGNDWASKGLQSILGAFATLQRIPVQLLVVGSDDVGPFRALAEQSGVLDRCRWELPSANVLDYYAASDLYVSPSREDSFGLPIAEAMACGLPVITSVYAGVSDLVKDRVNGFVLPDPSNSRTLAQLIAVLQGNKTLCQEIGNSAAQEVQSWTWEHNAEEIWKFLQLAAAKKKPRF
jgi:UDP-glucose:(heptosyl)LPS alpha-1,3-glucosyltransferase